MLLLCCNNYHLTIRHCLHAGETTYPGVRALSPSGDPNQPSFGQVSPLEALRGWHSRLHETLQYVIKLRKSVLWETQCGS
jgi:hypothetical protein